MTHAQTAIKFCVSIRCNQFIGSLCEKLFCIIPAVFLGVCQTVSCLCRVLTFLIAIRLMENLFDQKTIYACLILFSGYHKEEMDG